MAKDSRPEHHQEWRDELPYKNDDPTFEPKYHAECHCGKVKYDVADDPVACVICHCRTCQVVHGAPMQWAARIHKNVIRFDPASLDHLEFYQTQNKQPGRVQPCKVSCRACGTLIADEGRNMWLAFPTLFKFKNHKTPKVFLATDHMFYGQRCVDMERKEGTKFWEGLAGDSKEM